MSEITAGLRGEHRMLVTSEFAVDFLGMEEARVLGTPHLIGLLEMTARDSVKPHLDEGLDTVGTEVCIKHLAASPLGMAVTFHSEVLAIENRRIKFRVEAFDDVEKIAEGTHERFIINVGKFAARLQAKKTAL
jgi:fluoroacetyl-CoA thioesterase